MSTSTTLACQSVSLRPSSKKDSSPDVRPESSAPKSISDHISPTRTPLLLHSPNRSWHQSYTSFQTSTRSQCPRMHYRPWCEDCQTLTLWGPPPLTKQTCKRSIPTFGDLKTVVRKGSRYRSPFMDQSASQTVLQKVCSTWRDEQFAKAVAKRSAKMAAQEALRQSVHRQRAAHGAAPPATGVKEISTQLSISS